MKVIRVETNNNIHNVFYKILPELSYHRIPSKTYMQEGIMEIKPFNKNSLEAIRNALAKLCVRYTEEENQWVTMDISKE